MNARNGFRVQTAVWAVMGAAGLVFSWHSATAADAPAGAFTGRESGARAMVFAVGSDFTLDPFEGATLAWKMHRSAPTAWRFGLGLGASRLSSDSDQVSRRDTLHTSSVDEYSRRRLSLALSARYLRYLAPERRVSPYVGFGPGLSLNWDRTEDDTRETPALGDPVSRKSETRGDGGTATLSALVGVEWTFARRLGLHAEYGLSGGYDWDSEEHETRTAPAGDPGEATTEAGTAKVDRWFTTPASGRMGLSVYF